MAYKRFSNDDLVDRMTDSVVTSYSEATGLKIQRGLEWNAYRKTCPTAQVRNLAYKTPGDSRLFDQYQRTSQVGSIIATISDQTGARFSSARELSLIDGSCIGVRVTLVKAAL